ncbi:MAG: secretin N-terminal domain-containing protein [Planctomycetota bacterium]|jgi:general secretion pathway protein D
MRLTAALLALALITGLPALAQDITVQGDEYVLQFDETDGEPLVDFVDLAQKILQRPIRYTPADLGPEVRVYILGPQRVKQAQFEQYFQSVLKAYDYIVIEYGPQDSNFLSIQKISPGGAPRPGTGGLFYTSQAPIVSVEDLDDYQHDPAQLITTSLPLRYVSGRDALGTFSTYFNQPPEQIRNVENTNALVVTGFGSHVWGVWQLVQLIDQPPYKPTPVIHKRVLDHASVDEIQTVITDLLSAARGLRPGQSQGAQPGQAQTIFEIEPRIIPEPRSNALLISGEQEMVDRIEEWIDVLDVEVEPRGNTHVYRLKNTDATEVAEVLRQVLEQERLGAQQRAAGGQAGAAAAGGSALEVQASAVADRASNSLIITAGARKYGEIVSILRDMDVRRPQVLIEAAIVETSSTITDTLAAGIAAIGGDVGFASNFGTPTGLGAATDEELFDTIVNSGGNFAIVSDGNVPIPLLIQAISTDVTSRVLSRPYLLTNDNQEATISTVEQTSYSTAVTTQTSTTQSFENVEAGISLTISPTISAGNYLRLRVRIEVSNFGPASSGIEGAPPDITRREIETPVTLPDNHTAILGGLVSNTSLDSLSKVPFLGDLPLIGWLFRSSSDEDRDRYLYVFITPHIIDTDFALLDEISASRKRDIERLNGELGSMTGALTPGTQFGAGSPAELDPAVSGVFDIPAVAHPSAGDVQAAADPLPVVTPPAPPPPPTPAADPLPGFDEVFGYGSESKGG